MIRAVIFDMFETLITHYRCPVYFGAQMAEDAGIPAEKFHALWQETEDDRSLGRVMFEEVVERILRENRCYSEKTWRNIVQKRIMTKRECFRHLHPEILPLFVTLKEKGLLIGLISNCFSEEAAVIRESVLFPYFDAVFLSCEQGVQKPDNEIFKRCMGKLAVEAGECVYVGDGGSRELETAKSLGMTAVQAAWYLQDGTMQPVGRKTDFPQMENPLEVLDYV